MGMILQHLDMGFEKKIQKGLEIQNKMCRLKLSGVNPIGEMFVNSVECQRHYRAVFGLVITMINQVSNKEGIRKFRGTVLLTICNSFQPF